MFRILAVTGAVVAGFWLSSDFTCWLIGIRIVHIGKGSRSFHLPNGVLCSPRCRPCQRHFTSQVRNLFSCYLQEEVAIAVASSRKRKRRETRRFLQNAVQLRKPGRSGSPKIYVLLSGKPWTSFWAAPFGTGFSWWNTLSPWCCRLWGILFITQSLKNLPTNSNATSVCQSHVWALALGPKFGPTEIAHRPATLCQEARQRGGSASSALHRVQEVRLARVPSWVVGPRDTMWRVRRSKLIAWRTCFLRNKKLLGVPGIATSNKKLIKLQALTIFFHLSRPWRTYGGWMQTTCLGGEGSGRIGSDRVWYKQVCDSIPTNPISIYLAISKRR